jgi:arabinogalactan oligomer/maltooligosaccharide transport system permease protein
MFNSEYGAVNLILDKFFSVQISWLSTEWGAFAACLITNIWLGFPFMMIIALGGLQSIPDELYEAADIDGAGSWHKFRNITAPLLKPVMVPAITLGVIWTFNNFNVVWLVSNGGEPSDTTHILVSWVYKSAFTYFRMGYAAAFSMIIFIMLLIFSWRFIKKTRVTENVYG